MVGNSFFVTFNGHIFCHFHCVIGDLNSGLVISLANDNLVPIGRHFSWQEIPDNVNRKTGSDVFIIIIHCI